MIVRKWPSIESYHKYCPHKNDESRNPLKKMGFNHWSNWYNPYPLLEFELESWASVGAWLRSIRVQTDNIERGLTVWSIVQIEYILSGQCKNQGKRPSCYFMMDKARVINRVVTIVKDSQLYSFNMPTRSIIVWVFFWILFPFEPQFWFESVYT